MKTIEIKQQLKKALTNKTGGTTMNTNKPYQEKLNREQLTAICNDTVVNYTEREETNKHGKSIYTYYCIVGNICAGYWKKTVLAGKVVAITGTRQNKAFKRIPKN